jgi:pyrroline-5-carboxylate reductase
MGIAVLSGVVDSLESGSRSKAQPKWESHTPGTLTPMALDALDASLPSRYIACVKREESANKLKTVFGSLGFLGQTVEVVSDRNVASVQQADVVLLW